jgi:hypothetical protein
MYNYNTTAAPEYNLNADLIDECINLYGVPTKFLVVQKLNSDDVVFGDYSSIKTDNSKIFDVYMMPENSDSWDSGGYNFSEFGLLNNDSTTVFVSKNSVQNIIELDFKELYGNLVVMPNNKIMEVTDVQFEVPGVNNLFTYSNEKSVYKLTLKPYAVKLTDEINQRDISIDDSEDYTTLDNYFDELLDLKTAQDSEMEINPAVDVIKKEIGTEIDTVQRKHRVSAEEDSIFGEFN